MKKIERSGRQGDVLFVRVAEIPESAKAVDDHDGVIARSDHGHHHMIKSKAKIEHFAVDKMTAYVRTSGTADVVHLRPFHTHETLRLGPGTWLVRRAREHVPGGFRRIED
jgi:hypothetical protein